MITVNFANKLHDILIEDFGGSKGIRDLGGLQAALARPYATFDQQDLYPTPIDKAAALFESLIINHPFVDGNKRIAFALMRLMLRKNGFDIGADEDALYNMVIAASMGELKFEEIRAWLQNIAFPLSKP
jgi:death-on-curing protein